MVVFNEVQVFFVIGLASELTDLLFKPFLHYYQVNKIIQYKLRKVIKLSLLLLLLDQGFKFTLHLDSLFAKTSIHGLLLASFLQLSL